MYKWGANPIVHYCSLTTNHGSLILWVFRSWCRICRGFSLPHSEQNHLSLSGFGFSAICAELSVVICAAFGAFPTALVQVLPAAVAAEPIAKRFAACEPPPFIAIPIPIKPFHSAAFVLLLLNALHQHCACYLSACHIRITHCRTLLELLISS
jgi:hypothetical protein